MISLDVLSQSSSPTTTIRTMSCPSNTTTTTTNNKPTCRRRRNQYQLQQQPSSSSTMLRLSTNDSLLILLTTALASLSYYSSPVLCFQSSSSSSSCRSPTFGAVEHLTTATTTTTKLGASTIVPHPSNRNQHKEFFNEFINRLISSTDHVPSVQTSSYNYKPATSSSSSRAAASIAIPFADVAVGTASTATTATSSTAVATNDSSDNHSHSTNVLLSPEEVSYLQRKARWAAKYTSVDALRSTFGTNRNVLWGDLDPKTTRRLYKTLLPRALLELHSNAMMGAPLPIAHPEDLAPLAYQARVAAKLYARERCILPARIAANLYDGWRQYKKYGCFNCKGMSYQQLWEKYATVILEDISTTKQKQNDLTMEDVTAKICLKILERSCQTNSMVDNFVFNNNNDNNSYNNHNNYSSDNNKNQLMDSTSSSSSDMDDEDIQQDLKRITAQLEADAKSLLDPHYIEECSLEEDEFCTPAMLLADHRHYHLLSSSKTKKTMMTPATSYGSKKTNNSRSEKEELFDLTEQKLRLIRSILRMKRKFERFQQQQQQQLLKVK